MSFNDIVNIIEQSGKPKPKKTVKIYQDLLVELYNGGDAEKIKGELEDKVKAVISENADTIKGEDKEKMTGNLKPAKTKGCKWLEEWCKEFIDECVKKTEKIKAEGEERMEKMQKL